MKARIPDLAGILFCAAVVSHSSASPEATSPATGGFAADLYRQLAKENPGKNLFFSPYSMSVALTMAAEGARGETAEEMGKVLGFPATARRTGGDAKLTPWNTAAIHAAMEELQQRFKPQPTPRETTERVAALRAKLSASEDAAKELREALPAKLRAGEDVAKEVVDAILIQGLTSLQIIEELNGLLSQVDPCELHVANALYGEKTYPLDQDYLDTINRFYGTGAVMQADFVNNFDAERQRINGWVETRTKSRITNLFPEGSLDASTRLVLVNAAYFKGDWAVPFPPGATTEENFFTDGGSKVRVPMMRRIVMSGARYGAFNGDGTLFPTPDLIDSEDDPKTRYPDAGGFLIAELPYKGGDLSMAILMPRDGRGFGALEARLTSANLQTWLGQLKNRTLHVVIPKFKLETNYAEMKKTLMDMGMARAFTDPGDQNKGAQFDGMHTSADPMQKPYLSKVCHKAFVEVNEKGTEAAAATGGGMGSTGCPEEEPFVPTVRADKPFVFAIRDMKTGTILFLGRVVDPTK
jgi:serine protease inhibitor